MLDHILKFTVPAAYALLPATMATPDATRMLIAIGWQESRFLHRKQIGGPAAGWWQFETTGVSGVLSHPASRDLIRKALTDLRYTDPPTPYGCHQAIQHNDVLALLFARLLLWTLPAPLATTSDLGWSQYLNAWRPGKPHPETWAQAWAIGAGSVSV